MPSTFNVGGTNANVNAQIINFSNDLTTLATAGSPGSKQLYVDGNRIDTYTAVGSILLPFKTITAAVNQVSTNGDNGTYGYVINIAPGAYVETINLSDSRLVNLIFVGNQVIIGNESFNAPLVEAVNNDSLFSAIFIGIIFQLNGTTTHGIEFSSTTPGTQLGRNGIIFRECGLQDNVSDVYFNNVSFIQFDNTGITANINATNVNNIDFVNGNGPNPQTPFSLFTNLSTPAPQNFQGFSRSNCVGVGLGSIACDALSQLTITSCIISGTITTASTNVMVIGDSAITGSIAVSANGELGLINSLVSQPTSGPVTTVSISGVLISVLTYITATAITINSGGFLEEAGGMHDDGMLIVSSGGGYTATGDMGLGSLALTEHLNSTPGNPDLAGVLNIVGGTASSFTFENAFVSEPVVVVTPLNDTTSTGPYWVTASPTGFTITMHSSGTVSFNYVVIGNPN